MHVRPVAVALAKTLFAQLPQVGVAVLFALRQLEARQVVVAELKVEIALFGALFGDLHRVVRGLLPVGVERAHLLLVLEEELLRLELHAHGVVDGAAHLDAHEHVLVIGVAALDVVRVVGQHERDARLAADAVAAAGGHALLADAVVLDLEIEVLAEDLAQPQRALLRAGVVVVDELLLDLARETAREADEALGMLFEHGPVDARLDVKALGEGHRHEIAEVAVARLVLAQQNQVGIVVVAAVLLVRHAARGDVDLAADDGLHARLAAGLVKGHGAEHHAVIGQRDGLLAQLLDALCERVDAAGAVEQGVFAVDVQMNKGHLLTPLPGPAPFPSACAAGGSDSFS